MATNVSRPFYVCTEVTPECPVKFTTLGYYPNLGANIFFLIGFAICFFVTTIIGIWKRTWMFVAAVSSGLVLETVGYGGRVQLHTNPWNQSDFETQICAIILAPTLICVGIYLTLKHVALNLNPELSRVQPKWYPFIFLPADMSCLAVQAIGGGLAAAGGYENRSLVNAGNHAIVAGIALQVAVLLAFGLVSGEYFLRMRKWITGPEATPGAVALWADEKFRRFIFAVTGAYTCILLRCFYRIAEMAGGWGNRIMQDQPSFMVLDSSLVLVAVSLLSAFPPGLLFPQMAGKTRVIDGTKPSDEERQTKTATGEEPAMMESS